MTSAERIEYLRARSVEEGNCWIWQLACHKPDGLPIMGRPGRRGVIGVRRWIAEQRRGCRLPRGYVAARTCESPRCVNPAHVAVMARRALQLRMGRAGMFSGIARRAAIAAAARRAHSTLTIEVVRAIRASSDPAPVLAQRYGISRCSVYDVRSGRTWRDYSSPWAGLL